MIKTEAKPNGLFASPKTTKDVLDWCELHTGGEKTAAITAAMLMYNCLVSQFDLYAKEQQPAACGCDEAQEEHEHCVECDCILRHDEGETLCRWCEERKTDQQQTKYVAEICWGYDKEETTRRIFNTAKELEAYDQGMADMDGWNKAETIEWGEVQQ